MQRYAHSPAAVERQIGILAWIFLSAIMIALLIGMGLITGAEVVQAAGFLALGLAARTVLRRRVA